MTLIGNVSIHTSENYHRPSDCTLENFLSEFDLHHYQLKECGVSLPDAVIACRLMKSCNLSNVHFQLALPTTPKMTFEDMRSTLKKLFAETQPESSHIMKDPCGKIKN